MSAPRVRAPSRRPIVVLLAALLSLALIAPAAVQGATGTYRNPILPEIPGDGVVESCADPSVIRGQEPEDDHLWYMYCTTDPLNDEDRDEEGNLIFHLIPMFTSSDLVNWTYVGDAFEERPDWVGDTAGMWAPEITYFNNQYYLYYAAQFTDAGASAIGVATSDSPLGPWEDSGTWVVEPAPNGSWTFDPEVNVDENGVRWIFYGSYFGGIRARQLSADGTESIAATQIPITIDNRYEGAEVLFRDLPGTENDWYYLFVSATDCCAGPLTGYGVFVGRSQSLTGPYVDQDGQSLLDEDVGGTPVIYQTGNRWIGLGHNTVFQDFDGQWWTMYHGVDVQDPYFEGAVGFTKRPALLDAIDWVDGWPVLNGGAGPSDTPQHAPAAQPGDDTRHQLKPAGEDEVGTLIWADEFDNGVVDSRWSGIRSPDATEAGGVLTMPIQQADLHTGSNNASILVTDAPAGNWVLEFKVRLNVPDEPECCYNWSQAGVVLYEDDDNFIKAVEFANFNTRQGEFAKEVSPVPEGYRQYGNMTTGPVAGEEDPSDNWTWFRVVKRTSGVGSVSGPYGGNERYTVYTSLDGVNWTCGGTWAHDLGSDLQIGLVAMGATFPPPPDFTAEFDYVRVYKVNR
jgi:arabinan endo-1,5-alpha-L-arabinosidase